MVAAINNTLWSLFITPSNWTKNSVFNLLLDSFSLLLLFVNKLSASSKNITEGDNFLLISNNALTNFSLSPTHLLVNEEAEIEKNVALHWEATAFARSVFPVPGGPNNKIPVAGERIPVNKSGLLLGNIIFSYNISLAVFKPAISSHSVLFLLCNIEFTICSSYWSNFLFFIFISFLLLLSLLIGSAFFNKVVLLF